MIAAVVNAVVVILGAVIGLLLGGKIREELMGTLVAGLGISVVVIGITSAVETSNIIIVIVSIVLAPCLGSFFESKTGWTAWATGSREGWEARRRSLHRGASSRRASCFAWAPWPSWAALTQAFAATTRRFSPNRPGRRHGRDLCGHLGLGVAFSSLPVLVYQGALTLLASLVAPYLSEPW